MDENILTLAADADPLQVLTFCHLRRIGFLKDRLTLDKKKHPSVGMIFCRDGRTSHDEQQTAEGIKIHPYPLYGSTTRFSPYCPEMPDSEFGFKTSPNIVHCLILIEAIRIGLIMFEFSKLKAGIHVNWVQGELGCGWGLRLNRGLFQICRLGLDGRRFIKEESARKEWLSGKELEVMSPLHLTAIINGERTNYITVMDPHHSLVAKYNMTTVMGLMNDLRFLEIEAPDLLTAYRKDPTVLIRLWQEAYNPVEVGV